MTYSLRPMEEWQSLPLSSGPRVDVDSVCRKCLPWFSPLECLWPKDCRLAKPCFLVYLYVISFISCSAVCSILPLCLNPCWMGVLRLLQLEPSPPAFCLCISVGLSFSSFPCCSQLYLSWQFRIYNIGHGINILKEKDQTRFQK